MGLGCGGNCAKILLIIFNIVFWLSGAAILAVGLWLLLDERISSALQLGGGAEFETACYVLIGVGAFVFLVGFSGCAGAMCESKCLLGIYITCLLLVMSLEIAAGAIAAVYQDRLTDGITQGLEKSITSDNTTSGYKTWEVLQTAFDCCGANNASDYNVTSVSELPPTCCKDKTCTEGNVKTKGCVPQVNAFFADKLLIIIGVGIGIACLELFGVIFAIMLCCAIGKDDTIRVEPAPEKPARSPSHKSVQSNQVV